ncbi:MAG TPA: hypothetical protein VFJ16_19360 [Longimicrobium sp.]|nr:hypothetical protein [Longimicrobium sp.]
MTTLRITGIVQSGIGSHAQPIASARVTLYEATANEPRTLGTASTDAAGRFTIDHGGSAPANILYASAYLGTGLMLATVIGPRLLESIVINELTTVAAGFAMAQFIDHGEIRGEAFALGIAAGMSDNLVAPETGTPSEVMMKSPNADQTTSLRALRMLGNLLAGCVHKVPDALSRVLALTTPPHGEEPGDTFQAITSITLNPVNNVAGIYTMAQEKVIYTPPLEELPYAWTLCVKVNQSGDNAYMFGGPANVAFDERGYAWVANNVIQGTPNSASCIMVLKPNGQPADGTNGTPKSPVFGGGIFGVGFGVTVAPNGHVWVGNFGWGDPSTQYPVNGTVSELDASGRPISPDSGYGGGTDRVQATVADAAGNIWLASFGNNRVVAFPGGDPARAIWYPRTDEETAPGTGTFGIAPAEPGTAWVTYSGGLGWPKANTGVLAKYRINAGQTALEQLFSWPLGQVTKGMGIDSEGNVWVASGGNDTVYKVSADGSHAVGYTGGGISGPWSVAVDGDDNVWVANFGPMGVVHDFTSASVTKLAGIRPPEGYRTGDVLSGEYGYPLWSAGEQVLLADGTPLYGTDGPPCYNPLMRMTSVNIDAAGNLWAVNNWKPNFATDFETYTGNPGGDGIVIFVGVAAPPGKAS